MEGEQNAAGQELVLMGAAGMGEDRVDRRHVESFELIAEGGQRRIGFKQRLKRSRKALEQLQYVWFSP